MERRRKKRRSKEEEEEEERREEEEEEEKTRGGGGGGRKKLRGGIRRRRRGVMKRKRKKKHHEHLAASTTDQMFTKVPTSITESTEALAEKNHHYNLLPVVAEPPSGDQTIKSDLLGHGAVDFRGLMQGEFDVYVTAGLPPPPILTPPLTPHVDLLIVCVQSQQERENSSHASFISQVNHHGVR
ncbi:hypothetical protein INR49_010975, partial [Caranx melampygus]